MDKIFEEKMHTLILFCLLFHRGPDDTMHFYLVFLYEWYEDFGLKKSQQMVIKLHSKGCIAFVQLLTLDLICQFQALQIQQQIKI